MISDHVIMSGNDKGLTVMTVTQLHTSAPEEARPECPVIDSDLGGAMTRVVIRVNGVVGAAATSSVGSLSDSASTDSLLDIMPSALVDSGSVSPSSLSLLQLSLQSPRMFEE